MPRTALDITISRNAETLHQMDIAGAYDRAVSDAITVVTDAHELPAAARMALFLKLSALTWPGRTDKAEGYGRDRT